MSATSDPVRALWESARPEVLAMLDAVELAAATAVMEGLAADDPVRTEAAAAAHKLVGVGSFGFPTVGGYMVMTEVLLRNGLPLEGDAAVRLAESTVAVRDELERGPGTVLRETERRSYASSTTQRAVDVAVVEDDASLMGLLRYVLEDAGLVISEFTSGTSATAALLDVRPTVLPKVVLLDVDLPGRSGLSLLRALHGAEAMHRLKVIMMTARSNPHDLEQATRLGAHAYLAKPLDVPSLLEVVRGAIGETWS